MPRSEPLLDSSPIEIPTRKPSPPKRSHPAVSLPALPTPPCTRKRKRSHSRHSRATDSDDDSDAYNVPVCDSDDDEIESRRRAVAKDVVSVGNKKRKLLQVDLIAAELSGQAAEDAFWSDPPTTVVGLPSSGLKVKLDAASVSKDETTRGRSRSRSQTRSPSSSPPPHLLKRNPTGLLSPPRSRRHKSPGVFPFGLTVKAALPVTPPRKTKLGNRSVREELLPVRDSPDNPFLVHDEDDVESPESLRGSSSPEAAEPRTPIHIEKKKITYVFRGVRTEFDNPFYNPDYPETGVAPPDPTDRSKLPPEHPDFEPDESCPPKLLFPQLQSKLRAKRHRSLTDGESASEQEGRREGKGELKERTRAPPAKKGKGKQKEKHSDWDSSDEEDDAAPSHHIPLPGGLIPKRVAHPQAKDDAAEGARRKLDFRPGPEPILPQKDRSDPAKRALGPRRKGAL